MNWKIENHPYAFAAAPQGLFLNVLNAQKNGRK